MTKMTAEQVVKRLEGIEREWRDDAARMHANNPSGSVLGAASELRASAFGEAARIVRENLIESDDQRRERFERWCDTLGLDRRRKLSGEYLAPSSRLSWDAWQAAMTYRDEPQRGDA